MSESWAAEPVRDWFQVIGIHLGGREQITGSQRLLCVEIPTPRSVKTAGLDGPHCISGFLTEISVMAGCGKGHFIY